MWINTKVEFEWDGEKYVEVHSEGYEYEGILDHCIEEENGEEGQRPEHPVIIPTTERPWVADSAFLDWLVASGIVAPQLRDRITTMAEAEELLGYDAILSAWGDYRSFKEEETGDTTGDTTGDDDPNTPTQVGEKWIDSAGNLWASSEEAYASNVRIRQLEEKRLGRMADYERRFTEYEELIAKGTVEDKALAQRLAARTKGELKRDIRSVMYGMGETLPEGFEERLEESSTRSLLDMMSNIEQRNIAQLTAAKQFQIGTDITMEQLGTQEEGLEKQMYQYLTSQAQQQSQFESGLGFQQAEMALRKELGMGQLGLGRSELELRRELGMAEIAGMPEQIPWWQQMLVGFGQGAGTGAGIVLGSKLPVSDRRLKQNIVPAGQSPSGINIYQFNYLWDSHNTYQGVMAQEVPYASVMSDAGYYLVDYSKVDVEFRSI